MTSLVNVRLARFLMVGASGVAVNMSTLILLTEGLGFSVAIASLFAIELSILCNFALNNSWTWSDRRNTSLSERLLKYHLVAGLAAIVGNWALLILLTKSFSVDYRIANLVGIAAATALNFVLNHHWTFRADSTGAGPQRKLWDWNRLKPYLKVRGIPLRWNVTVAILLALMMGLRVVAMFHMTLLPEEAYYWMYSQHPSLSYFDHPPMVAWVIWFGTQLFGHTEFGVRVGVALMMLGASGAMYVFSRMWFRREAALVAALLLQILPVYSGVGLVATMDSALLFFWLLCLVSVSVALKRQRAWGWYLAGVGLGGAMLSKYTGIFLGLGALLVVVGYRPWRHHLRSVHPYAATLLAFALFSPVLIWNAQNDWASFRFQFMDRFANRSIKLEGVVVFVLMQLAVATPIILAATIWLYARTIRNWRQLPPRLWIALSFSLPLLLVMSYKSFRYGIHLNWTMPAYLSVFPALAQLTLAGWRWRRARKKLSGFAWRRPALATVVVCLALNVLALVYVLALQPRTGWISALGPWQELAAAVEKVEEQLEDETGREPVIIAGGKYRLASVLAFYRTPLETKVRACHYTTSQWILSGGGLGYPYWAPEDRWIDSDFVVVDDRDDMELFASRFKDFKSLDQIKLNRTTFQIGIGRQRLEPGGE